MQKKKKIQIKSVQADMCLKHLKSRLFTCRLIKST